MSKVVTWEKPNERRSKAHVVLSGNLEDGYQLACGATMPLERDGIELNPDDPDVCGNCSAPWSRRPDHEPAGDGRAV